MSILKRKDLFIKVGESCSQQKFLSPSFSDIQFYLELCIHIFSNLLFGVLINLK